MKSYILSYVNNFFDSEELFKEDLWKYTRDNNLLAETEEQQKKRIRLICQFGKSFLIGAKAEFAWMYYNYLFSHNLPVDTDTNSYIKFTTDLFTNIIHIDEHTEGRVHFYLDDSWRKSTINSKGEGLARLEETIKAVIYGRFVEKLNFYGGSFDGFLRDIKEDYSDDDIIKTVLTWVRNLSTTITIESIVYSDPDILKEDLDEWVNNVICCGRYLGVKNNTDYHCEELLTILLVDLSGQYSWQ